MLARKCYRQYFCNHFVPGKATMPLGPQLATYCERIKKNSIMNDRSQHELSSQKTSIDIAFTHF